MTIESCFGLFGCSLLIASAIATLPFSITADSRWKTGVVVLVLFACLVPIGGLALAGYLRGIVGDLSITTMLFLAMTVFSRLSRRPWLDTKERALWFSAIGAAALFLYPMALGLGPFDPYQLGFGSHGFITVLLALTLVAWWAKYFWLTSGILAAAIAYLLGLLESRNLWDYLVDPLLAGYVLIGWLYRGVQKLSAARRELQAGAD